MSVTPIRRTAYRFASYIDFVHSCDYNINVGFWGILGKLWSI